MMEKIKLCIVSSRIYSLFNEQCQVPFGGAEVQLSLLSKEFIKNKSIQLRIITGNYDIKKIRSERHNNILFFISQPLSKKILNYLKRPINLFLTLRKVKPDLVIQRVGGIETGICALYTKIFRKKFIYSIAHDHEVIKNGITGISGLFYRIGLKLADLIISQSDNQTIELELWKNKKFKNIKTINSGYEIPTHTKGSKDCILWVGRAVYWKRPRVFLRLAKKFPNEQFIIICNKDNNINYWDKLNSEAKEIGNVKFIEHVPFQKIDEFFKNSRIFINTSIKEGFPNTFIQSLKNKIPIISLNVDPDNFLTRNKIGMFCNNKFSEMVENLKLLLETQELYETYSRTGFLYVQKNHDIREISNGWIRLITKL